MEMFNNFVGTAAVFVATTVEEAKTIDSSQHIGPFILKESGLKDLLYVETFQYQGDADHIAHIYKTTKYFDNCDLEARSSVDYLDALEYNEDTVWREALQKYSHLSLREFRFLGPPLTAVMSKFATQTESDNYDPLQIFNPVGVYTTFYSDLQKKANVSIKDYQLQLAGKIEETVNMFLKGTSYCVYGKMNELRLAFDNREPTYDDLEKLDFKNKEFVVAINRIAKCTPVLVTLYNRDRETLGLPKLPWKPSEPK